MRRATLVTMTRRRRNTGFGPGLVLAGLLVGAQFAAALHAFAHESGTPQNPVCQACTAASHLGAASAAHEPELALPVLRLAPAAYVPGDFPSPTRTAPRQRGPPARS